MKIFVIIWTIFFCVGSFDFITSDTPESVIVFFFIIYLIPIIMFYFMNRKVYVKVKENKINLPKGRRATSEEFIKAVQDFKNEEKVKNDNVFVETKNTIYTDREEILDNDIPHLIEIGLKKSIEKEKSSINLKFHRSSKDEELSFNFANKYYEKISQFEEELYSEQEKIHSIFNIDEKIKQCQKVINIFYKFKNFCYKKSKGGMIYFQDMWEYCHNSNSECFSYIKDTEEYLDFLLKNYEKEKRRLEEEKEKQIQIQNYLGEHNPEIELLNLIKNNPGILQKDIYKNFDSSIKDIFKPLPRVLEKSGKIERIKKGNSYQLFIK